MKKNLTLKKLLKLGFKENVVTKEESGDNEYRYYSLELNDENDDCLISDSDDEIKDGLYTVNLFNSEMGYCYNTKQIKKLYKALKGVKLKKNK